MQPFLYSILAAFLVSLISLIGIIFIFFKLPSIKRITLYLVSFAIGGLLGDAFIHLLPESFEVLGPKLSTSILVLGGMLLFFVLEKILRWRHCHNLEHSYQVESHIVSLNLIGDTVHNLIDGMIIAASFIVSPLLGITTTIAIVLHEIPQEIGNFGIFIHQGLTFKKALFYNFLSALASILGVLLVFLFQNQIPALQLSLLPITAGGFIYLASSDLIPELHRHDTKISQSLIQLFFIILGVSLMSLLLIFE